MNTPIGKLVVWLLIGLLLFSVFKQFDTRKSADSQVPYSRLIEEARAGKIERIEVVGRNLNVTGKDGKKYVSVTPINNAFMVDDLLKAGVEVSSRPDEEPSFLLSALISFGPVLLIIGVWLFMMRQMNGQGSKGGPFSFGRSKARILDEANNNTTFADVAGCDEAKAEVKEIVDFLKEPGKFTKLGGRIPRGLLLVGPPGTGKTLLAKAIAGEAKVPFFNISGSDFVEMFVGVGASRVRDMFEQARKNAPCIIFIDEIDAVGRKRGAGIGGGNDEREQTLNQMLVEMDGFGTDQGIIVVAATNRADVLDPALLRPGRFDRQVEVSLPDIRGREQILKVHLRKVPLAQGVDVASIAKATPGFSGAELANLINEAALFAARRGGTVITMSDLEEAKDKIYMGVARTSMVMSQEEKRCTAYHEAGHAVVGCLLPASDPVYKATIIPRGRALGVVWRLPNQDRLSYHKQKMLADITVAFAGRIAEEVFLDDISSGASSDYQQATQIAKNMVTQWGMGEGLAPMIYTNEESQIMMGSGAGHAIHMSQSTMERVDAEIQKIVDTQYALAKKLITENMDIMHAMAAGLLQYETLDSEQVADIMARKPLKAPTLLNPNEDSVASQKVATQESTTSNDASNTPV